MISTPFSVTGDILAESELQPFGESTLSDFAKKGLDTSVQQSPCRKAFIHTDRQTKWAVARARGELIIFKINFSHIILYEL